jgi:branched-chain amino acid transport system permease protein
MTFFIQTVVDAISLGSIYALAALGIGLLFGMLRLINFAHGDFITVGAYSLIVPSVNAVATPYIGGWHPVILVATVSTIVIAVALLSDRCVFRYLRRSNPATLMAASFAVGYIVQNAILMVYGGRSKAIGLWPQLTQVVKIGGIHVPILQLVIISTTMILLTMLGLFMKLSRYGIEMRAAAEDFAMARYLGVRANYVIGMAFAISGCLAAVVSLLLVTQTGIVAPTMSISIVLYAFIATVIGGMGSLHGSVMGGLLVGTVSSFLQAYLPLEARPFRDAFLFAMVILLLSVRPSGLLRVRSLEERV